MDRKRERKLAVNGERLVWRDGGMERQRDGEREEWTDGMIEGRRERGMERRRDGETEGGMGSTGLVLEVPGLLSGD